VAGNGEWGHRRPEKWWWWGGVLRRGILCGPEETTVELLAASISEQGKRNVRESRLGRARKGKRGGGPIEHDVERRRMGPGVRQPRGSVKDGRWSGDAACVRDGTGEGACGPVPQKENGPGPTETEEFSIYSK
jgi:hypothetical protein